MTESKRHNHDMMMWMNVYDQESAFIQLCPYQWDWYEVANSYILHLLTTTEIKHMSWLVKKPQAFIMDLPSSQESVFHIVY